MSLPAVRPWPVFNRSLRDGWAATHSELLGLRLRLLNAQKTRATPGADFAKPTVSRVMQSAAQPMACGPRDTGGVIVQLVVTQIRCLIGDAHGN